MPTCSSRGFELFYEVHGSGGIPIVWCVGMGATGQGWLALQVPELARDRANVIFDPRGAGRSGDPGGPFTTGDLAEDLRAILDELAIDRAHVVGSFLGGLVAQELALAHPERVQSLTLIGCYAAADAKRRMLLELWKGLAERGLSRELWVMLRLCWTLDDETLEQSDLIETLTRFHLETEPPFDPKVLVRQLDACREHDARQRLESLRVPALVVTGENDILTPSSLARQLAGLIPESELVLMGGVGHLVMAEAATRFNRLVQRFVKTHDRRPA